MREECTVGSEAQTGERATTWPSTGPASLHTAATATWTSANRGIGNKSVDPAGNRMYAADAAAAATEPVHRDIIDGVKFCGDCRLRHLAARSRELAAGDDWDEGENRGAGKHCAGSPKGVGPVVIAEHLLRRQM